MGKSRTDLHALLKDICPNVYYQPPETVKMTYPCIVYQLRSVKPNYANNKIYAATANYSLTYICRLPDDEIAQKMLEKFVTCTFDRFYTADNLNHYSFSIYY